MLHCDKVPSGCFVLRCRKSFVLEGKGRPQDVHVAVAVAILITSIYKCKKGGAGAGAETRHEPRH